jgi:hypothetical protein
MPKLPVKWNLLYTKGLFWTVCTWLCVDGPPHPFRLDLSRGWQLQCRYALPATLHVVLASLWGHHDERFETALGNPCSRAWFESWGCVGCGEFLRRRVVLALGFLRCVGKWLRGRSVLCVRIWCSLSSSLSSWFCTDRPVWASHRRRDGFLSGGPQLNELLRASFYLAEPNDLLLVEPWEALPFLACALPTSIFLSRVLSHAQASSFAPAAIALSSNARSWPSLTLSSSSLRAATFMKACN